MKTIVYFTVTGLLVGAAAGVGTMRALAGAPPRAQPAASEAAAPVAAPEALRTVFVGGATARLSDEDRAELRALIRDELKAVRPPPAPAPDPSTTVDEMVERLAPASREGYARAQQRVERAIAARTWTEADRQDARSDLRHLPGEVQQQLILPLVAAVNRGDVRWEGTGPLY